MHRKTSNPLIIAGLVILLAVFFAYHVGAVIWFNSGIQNLQISLNQTQVVLNQTQGELAQVNAALQEEKAKIIVGQELRNFSSLDELKDFLAKDDTDEHEYIKIEFDCEDFSFMLQRHALAEGYLINCQKLPVGGIEHMCNMAIVGNEIYYIEPRTDKVTYMGYLD